MTFHKKFNKVNLRYFKECGKSRNGESPKTIRLYEAFLSYPTALRITYIVILVSVLNQGNNDVDYPSRPFWITSTKGMHPREDGRHTKSRDNCRRQWLVETIELMAADHLMFFTATRASTHRLNICNISLTRFNACRRCHSMGFL